MLAIAAVAATGLGAVGAAVPRVAGTAAAVPRSEPAYDYAAATRETVWVPTGQTAPDGTPVRVAADVIRPSGTPGPVPVIMDASPYYLSLGRGNESQRKAFDAAGRPTSFPLFLDNYFVPRGYAVVQVDLAGTGRSTGCTDVGGPSDVSSATSVVDWLNGRAPAFTAPAAGTRVAATWASGAVGMIGKSWDGTIANAAAATGVEGLDTIVPISAISSWYDYYRSAGAAFPTGTLSGLAALVENPQAARLCGGVKAALDAGTPPTGDLTPTWRARDYAASAGKVRASVLAVHGLNDLNVKTLNFGRWWAALPPGVEKKVWLSQTGHVDPFDFRRPEWVEALHRWFDHYLLGMDNGITSDPQGTVETAPDVWRNDPVWPPPTSTASLSPAPGPDDGVGSLTTAASSGTAGFTDDRGTEDTWVPEGSNPGRLLYRTDPLPRDVRVVGTPSITVTASSSTGAARLSALLVDYGPTTSRAQGEGEGIENLATRSCWGPSTTPDSACYLDTRTALVESDRTVLARGWADLGHHAGLAQGAPLTPGTPYAMTFPLATTDRVVAAGHRLGLVVAGTDAAHLTPPDGVARITVDLGATRLDLPVVGGL
ncbi:Xaa-Pro dipeptidyl-peptidase [Actinokineospora bangkokensis]|uniref:Xaa-Pro dipeptidyl-peptidase n=1 Tax=Actinokineospora bangkokensis TaxID=1193682 RepID=A0A1Q9LGI2_9PSEU|nr:Xaa-Pro dipeptidyl-peptidase [Actinokineospora bangkokensis]